MNVQINEKLLSDSAKIAIGTRQLQGKILSLIDQRIDTNIDHQSVLEKYLLEMTEIKNSLKSLYRQQKDFKSLLSTAEKHVATVETSLKEYTSTSK